MVGVQVKVVTRGLTEREAKLAKATDDLFCESIAFRQVTVGAHYPCCYGLPLQDSYAPPGVSLSFVRWNLQPDRGFSRAEVYTWVVQARNAASVVVLNSPCIQLV